MLLFRGTLGEEGFPLANAQPVTMFIASIHCLYLAVHVFLLVRETRDLVTAKSKWALDQMQSLAEQHSLRHKDKPDVEEGDECISPEMLTYGTFGQMLHVFD